jgi:hypothetical protein
MSTVSSTSTSSKMDELLSDMITRLQAIEAKQDRMGEQLKGLDPLWEKVASLEAMTTEIGATQETIAGAVKRINRAQLTLYSMVNRLETEQRVAHADQRPPGGDSLNDADGDTMLISHKLELPMFDGTGEPLTWLNRCARFFQVCSTPDHKVTLAAFYLTDVAQLWFCRLELNGDQLSWPDFMHRVNSRFGPPLSASPIGQLAWLRCTGNVNDYMARFMELSCRDESLTDHQQIQLYITDLDDPLRTDVQLQQPTKLDDAIIFARAYEQRNATRTAKPQPVRGGGRFSTRAATSRAPTAP